MVQAVDSWLGQLGLDEYVPAFAENEVDWDLLAELTNEDLKDLGVAKLKHRKILLAAIAQLLDVAGNQPEAQSSPTPAAGLPTAERRQLTVMFCDLVGSTSLSARVDPEELREVITHFQVLVSEAVQGLDGHVAKYMGDGVLCYFGWPVAHEEDAGRAVRAALRILQGIAQQSSFKGKGIQARIGVSTGLVVVGDLIGSGPAQEEAVVGETPNVAARLQAIAEPGQVVISAATRRLLGESFDLLDLGPQDLKGIPDRVSAFAVDGERQVESRFEAARSGALYSMIGREQELNLIIDRWQQSCAGNGQFVTLIGEPGIGKSRLVKALADHIAERNVFRLSYQCSPYNERTPLFPVIQQLTMASGFKESDSNDERLNKLEAILQSDGAPLIAALLGLDGEARYGKLNLSPTQQRARTLEALTEELVCLSRSRPVLFVLEDAHWIDATTLELISLQQNRIAARPVFVLITARPGFKHKFNGQAAVTTLELSRLDRSKINRIIHSVAGEQRIAEELVDDIANRSDGVPLFAEELTKATVSAAAGSRSGYFNDTANRQMTVPASLSDSLMARLDRNPTTKRVAQIAACIGRDFTHRLLAQVVDLSEAALANALDELCAAELIFRRGTAQDGRFTFKHALVSDTAYQSLLLSQRREIHRRLAEILQGESERSPELIARHLSGAGKSQEAFAAWEMAADAALSRAAHREAAQQYRAALDQLARLPESQQRDTSELRVLTRLGSTILTTEGWASDEANDVHRRAQEIAGRLDTSPELVSALTGLWLYHSARGEHKKSRDISVQLYDLARKTNDTGLLLQAHHAAWPTYVLQGNPRESAETVTAGLKLYDEEGHSHHKHVYMGHDPAVCGHSIGTFSNWAIGRISEAEDHAEAAIELSRRSGHLPSLIHTFIVQGTWLCSSGDHERLLRLAEELGSLADQHYLKAAGIHARTYRGLALINLGELTAGARDLEESVAAWKNAGARIFLGHRLSIVGEARSRLGQHEQAARAFEEAIGIVERDGEFQFGCDIYLRYGAALLATGSEYRTEARNAFETAYRMSQRQHAVSLGLRGALALARLDAEEGRRDRAKETLTSALADFPNGEFIEEVASAKSLLGEIG